MKYNTIIVGAGICGLCVALELLSKGQRVLMLEAQDYVGGRAKSIPIGNGVYFNEGANWFHGDDKNPFFQWAKARYDLGPMSNDRGERSRKAVFEGKDATEEFLKISEDYGALVEKRMAISDEDFSMADIAYEMHSEKVEALVKFKAQLWMAGDDPADIAVRGMYEDPLGVGGWQLANGMTHLIERIEADVRKAGAEIKVNAEVVSVQNTDGGVEIKTGDGSVFEAGAAVVTASVAVLKSGIIAFDTGMQKTLDGILDGFSMGCFYKAALRVDENYFQENNIPADYPIWIINKTLPKFIHANTGNKPTITVFSGGAQARAMEGWDKMRVKEFALAALAETPFFPNIEKHVSGEVITTSWYTNKFTRGAYSIKRPNCKKCDPVQSGNIIVAGEAWLARNQDSPGQMAGAFKSAQKAAEIILQSAK